MIDWDHLEAANAPLAAFTDFDRSAAFGEGPLSGLTIGIKANIAVAGLPWTGGMALRRDVIAEHDAAVVAKLRAAGAAIIGMLNMHEAALGATTDNRFFGRTMNPHRHGHTPGGSSGGSGAAVAAGLCDAALGTDTLGSIRIPAAYNGVYGLKPGHGVIDTDGLIFLGRRFDCIGPLTRDLDTLERVWAVIGTESPSRLREGLGVGAMPQPAGEVTGPPPAPPANGRGVQFQRLILPDQLFGVEVQPAVAEAYERARAAMALPEHTLTLPGSPTAIRLAALAEVARELIGDLGEDRTARAELISPELTYILGALEGMALDEDLLDRTRAALVDAIGADGVLLMPTAPQAAFAHGTPAPHNQADFTGIVNIAGLPALAIPAGGDADGLPVGVQLVGPAGSEERLIAAARALEPSLGGFVAPPRS
jgi:aspartyl-tRNA(Asn)/glutamyl-tRNA(Gln) amidotransferase subunit A